MKTNTRIYIAALGGAIEFFDFTLFVFLASILAKSIYPPATSSLGGIVAILSSVVASYLVRPLGGVVFGHLGDKYGRKKAFLATIIIISASMFLIAFLPPYSIAGIFSSITLLFLRILQGIAFGGDISTIVPYVLELSDKNKRTRAGGKLAASILAGTLASSILVLLLNTLISTEGMEEFGWRIAFFFAGIIGIIAIPLRLKLRESREFENAKSTKKTHAVPLIHLLSNDFGNVIKVLLVSFPAIFNYTYIFVLLPIHLKKFSNLSQSTISIGSVAGNIVILASILFFSTIADKVGREKVMKLGLFLFLIVGTPVIILLFYIPENIFIVFLMYSVLAIIAGPLSGCCYAYIGGSFPVEARCSGVAFVINVSVLLSGAMFPVLTIGASYFKASSAISLVFIACISLLTIKKQ